MASKPNVVVVGAGIIGASIAWHLAAARAAVTVVDAAEAGGIATPNSFAWLNASWGNPEPYFRLRMRAIAEWRRLQQALPTLPISWGGGLFWDLPADELETFAKAHRDWGYEVRMVGRKEIVQLEPQLADPPAAALYLTDEGAAEPQATAQALMSAALSLGARVETRQPVISLAHEHGKVVGVRTKDGLIRADEVVLAAGAGTPALLATIGLELEMVTPSGLLAHSRPHARLLRGIVVAPSIHMRQTIEGRIVAGANFSGGDPGEDPAESANSLLAVTRSMLFGAEDLALERYTIGYRPTPAGGFPVVGRLAGKGNLYVAVMHSGMTLAPAIGRLVADELTGEKRDPLLLPYQAEQAVRPR